MNDPDVGLAIILGAVTAALWCLAVVQYARMPASRFESGTERALVGIAFLVISVPAVVIWFVYYRRLLLERRR